MKQLEMTKSLLPRFKKSPVVKMGFVLVCRKSSFPNPDMQTHGTFDHLCGAKEPDQLEVIK